MMASANCLPSPTSAKSAALFSQPAFLTIVAQAARALHAAHLPHLQKLLPELCHARADVPLVGLPHHLVEAFKATLEELEYADLLIHVIDSADPERDDHIAVVDRLIAELAAPGTPVLECYNKCDLVADDEIPRGQDKVAISAASGFGLDALKEAVEQLLGRGKHHVKLLLPYAVGGMVAALHDTAQVLSSSYTENGIELDAIVDETLFGRLRQYVTEEV